MYKENLLILDHLINAQKKSFKAYIVYSIVFLLIGICVLFFGISSVDETIKSLTGFGGSFISSLSGFSLKEYSSIKDNISSYALLKINVELHKDDTDEQMKIKYLIQNVLIKKV